MMAAVAAVRHDDLAGLDELLSFAVPLRMWELRAYTQPLTPAQRHARMSRCAVTIGSHGDALQFRTAKTKVAIAALIDGLALAAFEPEGMTWRGLHWCTSRHDDCPRDAGGS